MSQLKCNPLHYAIATLTSATTFNQKKLVAKLLWLPFLGLLLHFFGVAVDRKSCSAYAMQRTIFLCNTVQPFATQANIKATLLFRDDIENYSAIVRMVATMTCYRNANLLLTQHSLICCNIYTHLQQ